MVNPSPMSADICSARCSTDFERIDVFLSVIFLLLLIHSNVGQVVDL
jgi:hypothetical protein